jgi:hypothetical protein
MNCHIIRQCLVWSSVAVVAGVFGCFASQTNDLKSVTQPISIKTKFVEGAKLSEAKVNQVVALAQQGGIKDATEADTFYFLPSVDKGISVKSKERVDGRNISYDTVYVNRLGWYSGSPGPKAKWLGDFWTDKSEKTTTLEREYQLNKKTDRIHISQGVDFALADKIITQIAAKKVHFPDENTHFSSDWNRRQFEKIDISNAGVLSAGQTVGEYELFFGPPEMKSLMFRVKGEDIFVTGIAEIAI